MYHRLRHLARGAELGLAVLLAGDGSEDVEQQQGVTAQNAVGWREEGWGGGEAYFSDDKGSI